MTYDPRTRPEKLASLALLVTGSIGLIASGVLFFAAFATHEVDGSRTQLPGTTKVYLHAGEYELWVQGAGGTFNNGDCDRDEVVALTLRADPRVIAPDGTDRGLLQQANCASAVPSGGKRAVSALHFTVATPGAYEIRGANTPAPESHLYVVEVHAILWTTLAAIACFFGSIGALVLKLFKYSG